ncbi:zinc ribbon domain-containing protein [Desulfonema ishimotonii]|uniref:Zinc ribbon domain-containing protein n=1 Tax=Desulfonema ishimotonii TaxID=45657 RepID=A0A401FW37_9BACT|nr:zinc ribbon domain-containing protein [Desulfonema ishimotonii]GBC61178.1 zinc ribbon domain-containing protein [Desulfonema ishimotonii]
MQTVTRCPKCGYTSDTAFAECPRCGIIVEKFLEIQARKNENSPRSSAAGKTGEIFSQMFSVLKAGVIHPLPEINPVSYAGRILLFVIFLLWGLSFIFTPMEKSAVGENFLHMVNTPFHEAGHIIFRPFGRFITSLGGTLGQLLMPLICMLTFIIKNRDAFAASVTLWWLAENFMDIAPYINDARAGTLPLLGGNTGQTSPYGFHDWEFILTETGLLMYDHFLARLAYGIGIFLMIASLLWGGFILLKQRKALGLGIVS